MKKIYIGLSDRLLVIQKKKNNYHVLEFLRGKKITALAFDDENDLRIYAGTEGHGLWRTEDGGVEWERIGEGKIKSSVITSLTVDPIKKIAGQSLIYAGTEPTALYYSADKGKTWIEFTGIQSLPSKKNWRFPPRPETHYARWITPSYKKENYLALSVEAGAVIHTADFGKKWRDRAKESPVDVHTLLTHPDQGDRLYAANGDGSSDAKQAYAESEDWGETWEYKSEGLEKHPYLYHMVIHSENAHEKLVSASKNASQAHRSPRYSTIYRKINDQSWIEFADELPKKGAYTHHLAEDPLNPGAYYAMNNYGIYYLPKGEKSWEKEEIDAVEYGFNQRAYCFYVK